VWLVLLAAAVVMLAGCVWRLGSRSSCHNCGRSVGLQRVLEPVLASCLRMMAVVGMPESTAGNGRPGTLPHPCSSSPPQLSCARHVPSTCHFVHVHVPVIARSVTHPNQPPTLCYAQLFTTAPFPCPSLHAGSV
jgi:hypothetical protein